MILFWMLPNAILTILVSYKSLNLTMNEEKKNITQRRNQTQCQDGGIKYRITNEDGCIEERVAHISVQGRWPSTIR